VLLNGRHGLGQAERGSISKVAKVGRNVQRLLRCRKKLWSKSLASQSVSAMKVIQTLEQCAQSCNVTRKKKWNSLRVREMSMFVRLKSSKMSKLKQLVSLSSM